MAEGMKVTDPFAAAPPGAAADTAADAIVARLGAGRFAIDLADVAEVGRVPVITRIPGVKHDGYETSIWSVTTDGASVGLLVDAVEGTTSIGTGLAPVPSVLPGAGAELLRGQVPREDGPIAVLDVRALARLRESLPRGRRSA